VKIYKFVGLKRGIFTTGTVRAVGVNRAIFLLNKSGIKVHKLDQITGDDLDRYEKLHALRNRKKKLVGGTILEKESFYKFDNTKFDNTKFDNFSLMFGIVVLCIITITLILILMEQVRLKVIQQLNKNNCLM